MSKKFPMTQAHSDALKRVLVASEKLKNYKACVKETSCNSTKIPFGVTYQCLTKAGEVKKPDPKDDKKGKVDGSGDKTDDKKDPTKPQTDGTPATGKLGFVCKLNSECDAALKCGKIKAAKTAEFKCMREKNCKEEAVECKTDGAKPTEDPKKKTDAPTTEEKDTTSVKGKAAKGEACKSAEADSGCKEGH